MATPSWIGATTRQRPLATQVNQFLGTHATTTAYTGAQQDHQNTVGAGATNSNATWIAQQFTPSSNYTSGRVVLTLAVTGSPSPWVISVQSDASGAPSGTVLATITLPNSFVPGAANTVSVPLSVILTSGTHYWIVAQAVGDVSNFYAWSKSNQVSGTSTSTNGTTWAAQTYGSLFQVWDSTATGPLVHTWEDSGARWTTLTTATGGQLNNLSEYTTAQNGSYVQSSAAYAYTSGQLTGVTQNAAVNQPQPWSATRSGLLGDTGAVNASAEINQFLGEHSQILVYQGNQILTPNGTGGVGAAFSKFGLNAYDIDQPFTMSGTSIGRVVVPLLSSGIASDLIVSLYTDSGGVPGTLVTQTKIPSEWIQEVAAVNTTGINGVGVITVTDIMTSYTGSPIAESQSNRFFMGGTGTNPWPYPTSGTGGPASGPISTYFGNYFIQLGGTNGGTTFYSDVYTIPYDTVGNLSAAVPQPQLPAPHDGSGAAVVSVDPSSGTCTLVLTGGAQVSGSFVNSVYTANFNPTTGGISSWSTQANLPVTMQFHFMAAWNGYVYAMGGTQGSTFNATSVYYAQVQNGQITAWTQTSSMPSGLGFAFSAACNGFVFVVGGFNNGALSSVYYAPVNSNGSLGAWQSAPSLPFATYALDALPCMVLDNYGIAINGSAHIMTLAVTGNGPDIAWQQQNVPGGGNFFALTNVTDGVWRYYGILGTSYITMQLALTTCVSVPLPATGLTNGTTYHILMQSPSGDLNNFIVLRIDNGTVFPGNPKYQYRAKGQTSWTSTGTQTIPIAVYDQTVVGPVWHTWEDSGARISSLIYATTPDQRLLGILEGVEQPGPILNQNPTFTSGMAPWGGANGTSVQSNTFTYGGLPFSAKFTPVGGNGQAYIESELISILLNHTYSASAWFYSPTGWTDCEIVINWYNSNGFSGGFISSSTGTSMNVPAGTWTHLTVSGSPPTNAVFGTVGVYERSTPPNTAVFYASAVTIQDASGPIFGTVTEINWSGQVYPPLGTTQLA